MSPCCRFQQLTANSPYESPALPSGAGGASGLGEERAGAAPRLLSRDGRRAAGHPGAARQDGGGVARDAGGDQEGAGEADRPREGVRTAGCWHRAASPAAPGRAAGLGGGVSGGCRREASGGGGGVAKGPSSQSPPVPLLAPIPGLILTPQTCPLLLRVFTTNNGRHHRMDEFSRGNVPSSELQIYTW